MKRSTILALAGAMTVFLTACGGESPKPAPSVNQEAPAAVEPKGKVEEDKSVGPRAEADTPMEAPAAGDAMPPEAPADQPAPTEVPENQ